MIEKIEIKENTIKYIVKDLGGGIKHILPVTIKYKLGIFSVLQNPYGQGVLLVPSNKLFDTEDEAEEYVVFENSESYGTNKLN